MEDVDTGSEHKIAISPARVVQRYLTERGMNLTENNIRNDKEPTNMISSWRSIWPDIKNQATTLKSFIDEAASQNPIAIGVLLLDELLRDVASSLTISQQREILLRSLQYNMVNYNSQIRLRNDIHLRERLRDQEYLNKLEQAIADFEKYELSPTLNAIHALQP